MITYLRVQNFKSWIDSREVKLAPLTGFFGTNSSGKSSLLQMLLLLKQTVGRKKVLFFRDENSLVNFGNFREVIHGHRSEVPLGFDFACKLTHPHSVYKIREYDSSWEQTINQFAFDSLIQVENGELIVERLMYGYSAGGTAEIVCEGGNASFPREYGNQTKLKLDNCYGILSSGTTEAEKFLRKFSSAFEELFSHVYYLGPARIHPQRHYHWEGSHPEDIGRWGDKAIDALLSARVDKLTIQREEKEVPIEEQISEWLREMDLAHSFLLERTGPRGSKDYNVLLQKSEHGTKVPLADMGYGLSQFLPVLVLCYYVPVGSTVILEQPGIHLHPKVQSQLADLLIEVVIERKLQILVESHSEHLLNRLQRRIAEEKIGVDQTALYFCRNDDGVSNIEQLEMDEFGNIANWPQNFFGDEMGDLFAMTKAQRERQKRAEG